MNSDDLPLLTEVLRAGRAPLPAPALASLSTSLTDHHDPVDDRADWEQLEAGVRESVLKSLQGRVDLVIEQRIRETLGDVLDQAIAGLTVDIKSGLSEALRDVIARAVSQEISRLKAHRVN